MTRSGIDPIPPEISDSPRWQHSLRDAVRDVHELLEILQLDPLDANWVQPGADEFPILVPRKFISRMRKGDPNDPLLRQVLPARDELEEHLGFTKDPLQEISLAKAGFIEKYPSRALIITTSACPVHCRYCFRRHFPYETQLASQNHWAGALAALKSNTAIREVILSGGDPLSLSNRRLRELVAELETIASVTTVRIHSRFPIVLPERVDRGLLALLEQTRLKTVLVVHCNHANEIDEAVRSALQQVSATGTLLLNQSVLLRGVNDDVDCLESLSYRLFDSGVLPYYLHQLDRVAGAAHFQVEDSKALNLIADLRKRVPGYLVPKLVQEVPGELSKIPLV
ncbi:MAG: EF-P beta-lysylation protein EpmB [Gammaproteobacteria bacterium]|nr:MAG: EF-P beta-lysylation protein EpmB [Gammaproteobacteria bacterium]TDJ47507.1 MAG: EF-P beta-lysylation protein EpmB [Gammaproteobacteria bacterium]